MRNLIIRFQVLVLFVLAGQNGLLAQNATDSVQYYQWTKIFEAQKGKLTCPMTEGQIDYKVLYLDSERKPTRGMDMMAATADVFTSMDGRVVAAVKGQNDWSVIIAHGDYFCVYSNLSACSFVAGQNVKAGALVGTALQRESDKKYVVHVEIWNGINHLWPADWFGCSLH